MGFVLRSDRRTRVVLVTFGPTVTDEIFLAGFAAVKDYVSQHGPHRGNTDFSRVRTFEISNEMLSQIGHMAPAIPAPMRRIVVAPEPASYVSARIVQALRADTSAPIEIVAKIDTALALLGTNCSDLTEV
jgi:hypothetical protein